MSKEKKKKKAGKAGQKLKALAKNPLLADVVAAALVATASALKDTKKAQQLALDAGDELRKLAKNGSDDGSELWEMALQIARRSIQSLTADETKPARSKDNALAKKTANKAPTKLSKKGSTKASLRAGTK